MDISFSGAEVAVILALLGAVTTPLGLMFKLLLAEKDRQIVRLERQNDQLIEGTSTVTRAVESATTALNTQRTQR